MLKILFSFLATLAFIVSFPILSQAQESHPKVLIKTSKGDIVVELFPDKAPLTVRNFLSYVDEKFYDGTIFHRVIKGFMIQAGGLSPELEEKPTKPFIRNEATNGLSNKKGTIAMGRMSEIHTISSHFYINHVDNPHLDHRDKTPGGYGYPVFGEVIKGMDIVDAIANVKTMTKEGMTDVPRETITILSIRQIEND